MRINNNLAALNTLTQKNLHNHKATKRMERISSGLRINRAADDAAGLSISEQMRGQIRGLEQANLNAQDGISLIQTAEAALHETHAMLQRQRELAVQAANGTNTPEDIEAIQAEVDQLTEEIDRMARQTEFNSIPLLDDRMPSISFQIGANAGQALEVDLVNATPEELGIPDPFRVTREDAITIIDDAIKLVSSHRSHLSGAVQNRLEHAINNLHTMSQNLSETESRIRDADVAVEMVEMTKANILSEAAQAMLAQANQQTQTVLQLLQ